MIDLPQFPFHSSSIWDYLDDMPYMPSARDRQLFQRKSGVDKLRVRIWDYFFRPKDDDVGKPVRREIEELTVQADRTEAETTERLNTARKRLAGFEEGWRSESAAVTAELQRIEAETGSNERRRAMTRIVVGEIVGCSGVVYLTLRVSALFQVFGLGIAPNATLGAGCGLIVWLMPVVFIADLVVRAARRRRKPEQIQARIAADQQHVRDRWSPRDEAMRREIYDDRARVAADEELLGLLVPHLRSRIAELTALLDNLVRQIPRPPTEAEIENWLADDLRKLRVRGEERHAMEGRKVTFSGDKDVFDIQSPAEIQDPASIPAAYRDNADREKHLHARQRRKTAGPGRVDHYGVFSYEVIFIADTYLARYSVLFDFIEGEPIRESAPRQHYVDFVSVEMHHEFREIRREKDGEGLPVMLPSMILALSNGDRVTITVPTSAYFDAVEPDSPAKGDDSEYKTATNALKAITEKVYEAKRMIENRNP